MGSSGKIVSKRQAENHAFLPVILWPSFLWVVKISSHSNTDVKMASGKGVSRVQLFSLVFFVCMFTAARAWPRRMFVYECCCQRENPSCGSQCFLCRNSEYKCECDKCSCYSKEKEEQAENYLQKLLNPDYWNQMKRRVPHEGFSYRLLSPSSVKTLQHG